MIMKLMTQGTLFPSISPEYKWIPAVVTYKECDECGESFAAHELNPNSHMCEECHNDNHTDCDGCGASIANNDIECSDSNDYCHDCYNERCTCSKCGKVAFSPDRLNEDDDGNRTCDDCYYNTLHLSSKGTKVISNKGCKAPIWDIQKTIKHLLLLMERCKEKAEYWSPHTKMWWGDYEIDNIDMNGVLHIGCHQFKIEEIERFIREELYNFPLT